MEMQSYVCTYRILLKQGNGTATKDDVLRAASNALGATTWKRELDGDHTENFELLMHREKLILAAVETASCYVLCGKKVTLIAVETALPCVMRR